ncbi:hypothetical protein VNO80_14235 [Phaseolus coccineus]|uniref:Uncharacterized protein n=1 Tax=Phaseolus coccineus TaxID=3886 RepID=A0AAN9MHJ0_PHACN
MASDFEAEFKLLDVTAGHVNEVCVCVYTISYSASNEAYEKGSLYSHACHSLSNGTATVYDVVISVVLAPCMDPKDRKSSGLGDLKYPLVSDVTKITKSYGVPIPDESIKAIGRSVDEVKITLQVQQNPVEAMKPDPKLSKD